ncbi:Glucokinase [Streptococcus sp. ZB199]|nr:Glucokinase [Streptococcus sp. ZB199]
MSKKIIGIDLGGTSIKFAILTLDGEVQEKWSIKTNILDEGSHIVDDMIESIAHRLKLLELDASEFQGIGMGSPGVVDREKGTVIGAYNLNWKTLQPVKEKIETALHIPFFIDNDANVAALGERWKGAGENQPDVVFMTLGTGVGGESSLKVASYMVCVELLVSLVISLLILMIRFNVPVVKKDVSKRLHLQQVSST